MRSLSGSAPASISSTARVRRHLALEAFHQHVDLFLDQGLEGAFVTQGVVDGEPDLLVVATGPEPRHRFDDRHVGRRIAP